MFSLREKFTPPDTNPLQKEIILNYNENRPSGPLKYLCYAPFKSLYFGHQGKVIACCANRSYVLGEYPADSIMEIWQGDKANQLREHIQNNDLSQGCHVCKKQILAKNYNGLMAVQYDTRQLNSNGFPVMMEFELSNLCNLECEMCNGEFSSLIRANRENLPPRQPRYDDAFVEQLEEFIPHLHEVVFYGGEPFLIELYYKIWKKIGEINPQVRVTVQTNATILNNRVKGILEEIDFNLNISIDSLDKRTYERIRKNANYDQVRKNIEFLHSYSKSKGTFFGLSFCAMQSNWQELPEFVNYCNNLDASVFFHTVRFPAHVALRNLSQAELSAIEAHLLKYNGPSETPTQIKNRNHYFDFVAQISAWRDDASVQIQRKKLSNFNDLLTLLIGHINNDPFLTGEAKKSKIVKVQSQIAEIEKNLEPALIDKIFLNLDGRDPLDLDNLVYMMANLSAGELISLARPAGE